MFFFFLYKSNPNDIETCFKIVFVFGCVGSSLLWAFPSCIEVGATLLRSSGFSLQCLLAEEHRL